jgi:ABC-type branched-subunit amino acid transport system substrate-binding protein
VVTNSGASGFNSGANDSAGDDSVGDVAGADASFGADAVSGPTGHSSAARSATGTGSSPSGSSGSSAAPAKASGPPIKVGILILDLGNVTALGFPAGASVQDMETVWQYWIDQYNAAGGVNGRPIEAYYVTYDPLQEASMRQACLELTENKKVFLAVASGGFVGPPMLCFTEEHGTPLLVAGSSGVPQEFYPRSKGLLLSSFQGSDRTVMNLAQELDNIGALKNKRVGIMFDLRSGPASIADKLESELKHRGHTVAHKSVYSADYQTAASQVPVEVQQMQANNVDVIVNMAHTLVLTQFTQDATSQGYTPPYYNSDWNGANSDFYYSNMPASYDGNINFTITRSGEFRVNAPEPPLDKQCREDASKALGRTVPRDDTTNGAYARDCAFFEMMTRGLAAAVANKAVTPIGFSEAVRRAGTQDVAGFGAMAFGADRYDGADFVRTSQWHANCKCVVPVTGFRQLKY